VEAVEAAVEVDVGVDVGVEAGEVEMGSPFRSSCH